MIPIWRSLATLCFIVNGKIRSIDRSITPTIDQPDLTFDYGPDGQRIRKAVTWSTGGDTTWYVRDAQGNVMATYLQRNDSVFAQEHYMYGSSRLGSSAKWTYVSSLTPHADTNRFARVLGHKNYELTNHLGNVLTTISNQKKAIQDGTTGTIAHWTADVVSYSDYYPGGSLMPGRNGNTTETRHGFNGMEKDNEVYGDGNSYTAEFWQYDSRLLRRWNMDPVVKPHLASYVTFSNNPILRVDPDGDDDYKVNQDGEIKFVRSTEDATDRLISVRGSKEKIRYDKNGNLKNASIELEKGILSEREELSGTNSDGDEVKGLKLDFGDKKTTAKETFQWLALNTDVEWGFVSYSASGGQQKGNQVYTSHIWDTEYFSAGRALLISRTGSDILESLEHHHSHPYRPHRFDWGIPSSEDKKARDKVQENFPEARFFLFDQGVEYEYTNKK